MYSFNRLFCCAAQPKCSWLKRDSIKRESIVYSVHRRDVVARRSRVGLVYPHWPMFSNTIVQVKHTYCCYWLIRHQQIWRERTGHRQCELIRAKNPSYSCAILGTSFSLKHSTFDNRDLHIYFSMEIPFLALFPMVHQRKYYPQNTFLLKISVMQQIYLNYDLSFASMPIATENNSNIVIRWFQYLRWNIM